MSIISMDLVNFRLALRCRSQNKLAKMSQSDQAVSEAASPVAGTWPPRIIRLNSLRMFSSRERRTEVGISNALCRSRPGEHARRLTAPMILALAPHPGERRAPAMPNPLTSMERSWSDRQIIWV